MNYLAIWIAIIVVCLVLLACSGGGNHKTNPSVPPQQTSAWRIGPIANGKNYSEGMPAYPTIEGAGWGFAFPSPGGGVDAVENLSPESLVGVKAITVKYSVTGSGFYATGETNVPGRVGFCIQRRGDNWSGAGKYQQYRLYGTVRPLLVPGAGQQFTVTSWTDVKGQPVDQVVIDSVLNDLGSYMIVFGGSFASHGVYATQPSTFHFLGEEFVR
jgi:hypothetical protein